MAATNKALWNVEQSSGTSSHLLSGLRMRLPHCITQVPGLHGYKNNWHKNPIFSLYLIIYLFAASVIKYVHFEKEFGFLVSEVLPNYGCREMMCSACHKHGTKKNLSAWQELNLCSWPSMHRSNALTTELRRIRDEVAHIQGSSLIDNFSCRRE